MEAASLKSIYLEVKSGKFRTATEFLTSKKLHDEVEVVCKIVTLSCAACSNPEINSTIEVKDLSKLLIFCSSCKLDLKDNALQTYLQSVYFILKFLIEQANFAMILQLQDTFLPVFISNISTNQHQSTYTTSCNLMHNSIVRLAKDKTATELTFDFCNLFSLIVNMTKWILPIPTMLDTRAIYYFKYFNQFSVPPERQISSYNEVLDMAINSHRNSNADRDSKVEEVKTTHVTFGIAIGFLRNLVANLFKQNNFKDIRMVVKTTVVKFSSKNINSSAHLLTVLKLIEGIISKVEDYPEKIKVADVFSQCYKNLKSEVDKNGFTRNCHEVSLLVYTILFNLSNYYKGLTPEKSKVIMDPQVHMALYKLIKLQSQITSQCEVKCGCLKCNLKYDILTAINISLLTPYLAKLALNNNMCTKLMLKTVYTHLEQSCAFVRYMISKNCILWKTAWAEIGTMAYNFGTHLFKVNNEDSAGFLKLFISNLTSLEGTQTSVIKANANTLNSALICLSEHYIKKQSYEKAMVTTAFNLTLHENNREQIFSQWVRAKNHQKDIDGDPAVQEETIVSILEKFGNFVKDLYGEFVLTPELKVELLVFELKQYKQIWCSKIPMMSCLKHLLDIASALEAAKCACLVFLDNNLAIHENIPQIILEIIEKLKTESTNFEEMSCEENKNFHSGVELKSSYLELYVYLACLNYIYYNNQMTLMRQKTLEDMDSIVTALKPPQQPHDVPKDPNDECDIVTCYDQLNLECHGKIIKHLHNSLDIFEKNILQAAKINLAAITKDIDLYQVLTNIAHEYKLQCYALHSTRTWFLCLKLSRILDNHLAILESIGFILESTKIQLAPIEDLIKISDEITANLSSVQHSVGTNNTLKEDTIFTKEGTTDTSEETLKILTGFYLNKSYYYYQFNQFEPGFREFQNAQKCHQDLAQLKSDQFLKIRVEFLHSLYMMLPCTLKIMDHAQYSNAKIHEVLKMITNYFKTEGRNSSHVMTVLFDVSTTLAHIYKWLKLPREIRCYCKQLAVVAQQLFIPLKAAYALSYLAEADILTSHIEDCQVKIDGISNILCLSSNKNIPTQGSPIQPIIKAEVKSEVDSLVNSFQEFMLECPTTSRRYQGTTGSPILYSEPFKLPHFINHHNSCMCYQCTSLEFQELVFVKIYLEIQLNTLQNNLPTSKEYFNGALRFYSAIKSNRASFNKKILKIIPCGALCNVKYVSGVISEILLEYSNSLMRIGDREGAKKLNHELMNIVKSPDFTNFYLRAEAQDQKANIMWMDIEDKTLKMEYLEPHGETDEAEGGISKTPENKQSTVFLRTAVYSPGESTIPKKKLVKCIKFDLSEADDYPQEDKKSLIPKASKIKQSKTPVSKVLGASSKIKIYTPATEKSTRKKKQPLLPKPEPSRVSNIESKVTGDDTFIIPMSPEAYTPSNRRIANAKKTEPVALRSRTKLLTEKLKCSGVKNVPDIVVTNENDEKLKVLTGKPAGARTKTVRKNLMSEMTDVSENSTPSSSFKPMVRKSTRTARK